ncbi:MAG: DoxX family protein [Xanthobacteraceae bacterium]
MRGGILLLLGRWLIAAIFLMTVWTGGPSVAYLTSINFVAAALMSPFAYVAEWIVVVTLVFGLATRYGALLAFAFVVIAFLTAHLYWQFPQAAQGLQFVFLSKDIAIAAARSCCSWPAAAATASIRCCPAKAEPQRGAFRSRLARALDGDVSAAIAALA